MSAEDKLRALMEQDSHPALQMKRLQERQEFVPKPVEEPKLVAPPKAPRPTAYL